MIESMAVMAVSGFSLAAGFTTFTSIKNLVVNTCKKIGSYINLKVTESWLHYQATNHTSIWMMLGRVWAALGYRMGNEKYMNMVKSYKAPAKEVYF